jgi:phosphopantothenoylcysteine synthetase/decarboxylase
MVAGVLTGYNTLGFTEGDLLYAGASVLTNVQPTNEYIKFIGYVLNRAENGKILISNSDPFPDAKQIAYDNTGTELTANNVQDAISEVNTKIATMEEIVFQQATAPTIAEGASDGDIWMDTTTNTLNVYREYPLGTNVYRWEPLLYKWDDTVDGGSW